MAVTNNLRDHYFFANYEAGVLVGYNPNRIFSTVDKEGGRSEYVLGGI